jgi:hypothetical protein
MLPLTLYKQKAEGRAEIGWRGRGRKGLYLLGLRTLDVFVAKIALGFRVLRRDVGE